MHKNITLLIQMEMLLKLVKKVILVPRELQVLRVLKAPKVNKAQRVILVTRVLQVPRELKAPKVNKDQRVIPELLELMELTVLTDLMQPSQLEQV